MAISPGPPSQWAGHGGAGATFRDECGLDRKAESRLFTQMARLGTTGGSVFDALVGQAAVVDDRVPVASVLVPVLAVGRVAVAVVDEVDMVTVGDHLVAAALAVVVAMVVVGHVGVP